ncbi:hypothetical protein PR001_g5124 [Phytophthora rubi]|uniref:Uncharacterized protein n=1 Tax=Phytophthora rubi TaxID=129364 RepID=A0A6A3NNM2_9STRA|nr:hypothetical protein PR001_g5124 [Phytophthora rubi]KAE9048586.1 hypothetical protein PR002_g380 [Phytophthora rubi]
MTSWQRYPGEWTKEDEAARLGGRNGASAPPAGFEKDEEKQQEDHFRSSDGRAQRSQQYYVANSYERMNPPPPYQQQYTRRQPASTQFPGYPAIPPQGYAGYSTRGDVQEPVIFQDQWTYPAPPPRQPSAQSTDTRGQWMAQNHWVEGPAAPSGLQLNEGYGHGQWGRSGRRPGPPLSSRSRVSGFLAATLRLGVYHVINFIFALVACGILSAGICSAASLIPVCCIGLLIFQVLVYIVFSLAQWDIRLGNYISPAQQRTYASLLPPGRFVGREGLSGYRISPSLAFFSPLSLMAMLYFVLVKPVIGALSFLSVLLVVAPTVAFITSLTSRPDGYYDSIEIYGVGSTSMSRYPGLSLAGAICVTLGRCAHAACGQDVSRGHTVFLLREVRRDDQICAVSPVSHQ